MAPRTAAGNAERPNDAPLPKTTDRLYPYTKAKNDLHAALTAYLDEVVNLGNDSAANLELARVTVMHDLHAAINERLMSVPFTIQWALLVEASRRVGRG